ncbi:ATP synthase subunit c family protein [Stetteria hydrogenophila]
MVWARVSKALKDQRLQRLALAIAILAAAGLALSTAGVVAFAQAEEAAGGQAGLSAGLKYIAAALAVGLAGIGAGYAIGVAGAAAVSAVTEKPEVAGTALLYVALGEGVAIYGLLIAILLLFVV